MNKTATIWQSLGIVPPHGNICVPVEQKWRQRGRLMTYASSPPLYSPDTGDGVDLVSSQPSCCSLLSLQPCSCASDGKPVPLKPATSHHKNTTTGQQMKLPTWCRPYRDLKLLELSLRAAEQCFRANSRFSKPPHEQQTYIKHAHISESQIRTSSLHAHQHIVGDRDNDEGLIG